MNARTGGFEVDHAELGVFAGKAKELAEELRAGLRDDRFEDSKWPDTDGLRAVVTEYLASLRTAMSRLSGAAAQLAEQLEMTAESYRQFDDEAAREFDGITRP